MKGIEKADKVAKSSLSNLTLPYGKDFNQQLINTF